MNSDAGFIEVDIALSEGSGERPVSTASPKLAEGVGPRARGLDSASSGLLVDGKYRLVRRLAEGGMGAVWLAHNETLDVDVALKVLRSELTHPHLEDRLLTEARAAARLNHPAIVRVSDFGRTEAGDPYIVMELLEGEDLGSVIEREGRATATTALALLLPVIHALALVHEKGIVHRDLKPENIVLAKLGGDRIQPKLVDFGIAKLDDGGFERVTNAGAAVGSPAYMSPEQARGLEVDARTDIWAMSVVLYEILTGELPFKGDNHNALLYRIWSDAPKPLSDWAAGDDELWAILSRGLAKEPADRWQSMRQLGSALARWLLAKGVREDVCGTALEAVWGEPGRALDEGTPAPSPCSPEREAAPRTTMVSEHEPGGPTSERGALPAPERRGDGSGSKAFWLALLAAVALATAAVLLGTGHRARPAALTLPEPLLIAPSPTPGRRPPVDPSEPRVEPVSTDPAWLVAETQVVPAASTSLGATARPPPGSVTPATRRPATGGAVRAAPRPKARSSWGRRAPKVESEELELKTRL